MASRRLFDENDRLYYKNFYSYTLDFHYNGLYNIIQMPDNFYNSKEDTKMTKKKATQKATEKTVSAPKATEATRRSKRGPGCHKALQVQKSRRVHDGSHQSQESHGRGFVEIDYSKVSRVG